MTVNVTNTEVAATLRAAADHIDQYGWHQGDFAPTESLHVADGPCCAAGAINVVRTGLPQEGDDPFVAAAKDALLRRVWDDYDYYLEEHGVVDVDDQIATWNDQEAGGAAEVTATLRAVADAAAGVAA